MAIEVGYMAEEIALFRQGVLLHDIGKMGIPDSILLKPGPLEPEEWVIMRQHPIYAWQLLKDIPYLQQALDIPYYHHEKWDGSGYPLGLEGEEIPLSARIFAIVDVWDALNSDRPYRPAWPEEEVIEYIRQQSGKHFDPKLVELFLRMMGNR
jgi:HD-GYP domain-containing protein (c-di-GMP phosphodiesterase class II)